MSGASVPGKWGLDADGEGTVEAGTSEAGAGAVLVVVTPPRTRELDAPAGETELGDDSSMGPLGRLAL